jgi:hypothetical protein
MLLSPLVQDPLLVLEEIPTFVSRENSADLQVRELITLIRIQYSATMASEKAIPAVEPEFSETI